MKKMANGTSFSPRIIVVWFSNGCRGRRPLKKQWLAGATADVHCYDVLTNKWSRLTPYGEPPSPRAAHVATAVGTMVVIQIFTFLISLNNGHDGTDSTDSVNYSGRS
ncbi:hypothetical protein F2Q69_00012505 [Brassica cretica]|uniref:Uncharacterized protein n=1 Tax=Brassica cretica TaxID=69181 RepID=A0A8S9QVV1_BRACR|nr:hypothetical protein F2Q69_00012505 [Brassica cretica]